MIEYEQMAVAYFSKFPSEKTYVRKVDNFVTREVETYEFTKIVTMQIFTTREPMPSADFKFHIGRTPL